MIAYRATNGSLEATRKVIVAEAERTRQKEATA